MEGITFYREGKGKAGNVFAAFVGNGFFYSRGVKMVEGLGGVYDRPNSPVAGTSASTGWLQGCKIVDEAEARRVHPNLFAVLDNTGA